MFHDLSVSIRANMNYAEIGVFLAAMMICLFFLFRKKSGWTVCSIFWGLTALYITVVRRFIFPPLNEQTNSPLASYLLNIALFMPFGFCLQKVVRHLHRVAAVSALLSGLCELLQMLTGCGEPDLIDLLCNTAGGLLGAGVCILFFRHVFTDRHNAADHE